MTWARLMRFYASDEQKSSIILKANAIFRVYFLRTQGTLKADVLGILLVFEVQLHSNLAFLLQASRVIYLKHLDGIMCTCVSVPTAK